MQPTWSHSVLRPENSSTQSAPPEVTRGRLRWLFWAFVAGLFTVYVRLLAAQWHDGPDYRAAAAEPMRRVRTIAAPRGKILARDGTVLADDRPEIELALNYRWLQEPADPAGCVPCALGCRLGSVAIRNWLLANHERFFRSALTLASTRGALRVDRFSMGGAANANSAKGGSDRRQC